VYFRACFHSWLRPFLLFVVLGIRYTRELRLPPLAPSYKAAHASGVNDGGEMQRVKSVLRHKEQQMYRTSAYHHIPCELNCSCARGNVQSQKAMITRLENLKQNTELHFRKLLNSAALSLAVISCLMDVY
jgi:hypothetical protein